MRPRRPKKSPSEARARRKEGGGGNSAAPEPKRSPAALLVQSRVPQKSFLFLLEEKEIARQIKKCEENFFAGWRALASGAGEAGGKIIYLLDTGKIQDLKFPTFWFDSTPQGKFMLSTAFGQSKYYVDNLSENIKRGHRQKLRKGIWPVMVILQALRHPLWLLVFAVVLAVVGVVAFRMKTKSAA